MRKQAPTLLVLHTIWDNLTPGRLHIWGEAAEPGQDLAIATVGRGRPRRHRPHPFAISGNTLAKILFGDNPGGWSCEVTFLSLFLPSTSLGPLPSPETLRDTAPDPGQNVRLTSWQIPTLAFPPGTGLDLLLTLPGQPPPGLAFGASLRFWMEAARFTLELSARGCFLPGLQKATVPGSTKFLRAVWEITVPGEDSERMERLASAMPPVCRAFSRPGRTGGKSPLPPPSDLVLGFVQQAAEDFIRTTLAEDPPLPSRRGRPPKELPPLEQWLEALSSSDPVLDGSSAQWRAFAHELGAWLNPLQPDRTPFRTCFRLDPPAGDSGADHAGQWRLSFFLQAQDDGSLLIPTEDIWRQPSRTISFLRRRFENPQERLLADLGKAARIFPPIEESLQDAYPSGIDLSPEQAYAFLRQAAPLLKNGGFGVLLPPWWQAGKNRVGIRLQLKPAASKGSGSTSSGLVGLNNIVAYDWQLAVGDATLSPEEFAHLAQLKVPLVQLRGQWVELRPEEIEAAIAFFSRKHPHGRMTMGEALRLGLEKEIPGMDLPVVSLEGKDWTGELLEKLSQDATPPLLPQPASLQGELRPYQRRGFSWLAFLEQYGLGGCLADDMGLGKTIQLIALLLHERQDSQGQAASGPTLLVCPMSVVGNWQRELARFGPSLKVLVHHGSERLSGSEFIVQAAQCDVVLTTYSLVHRDLELLSQVAWQRVVLDEAQNIKNQAAKQTQAILSLQSPQRVALTGTPLENRLTELWTIMEFLNPGYLGSAQGFQKRFAVPIEKYQDKARAEQLQKLIQPFVLRRLKTDRTVIRDLPDKMEMKVFCHLTPEQATLYQATVQEMLDQIETTEGIERKGLVLATLTKLKQVCNHPVQFMRDGGRLDNRSGKLIRLMEMLEEVLAEGDKALIFTQFAEMGSLLQSYLQKTLGQEVLFLHGGTSQKQREDMIRRFQEEQPGPPLFILSLKAGGVGLNLTAANHVFHFDRWWNPAVENQATDRAFRIGQRKNVQVHKLICLGTVEERIDLLIDRKKELAESIIGAGESWLTELSTDQLRELFTLGREAIGGD